MNNTNIVTLYHGSVSMIDSIDISKGKPYKDFGRGFYTSKDPAHATNLALRNMDIEKFRLRNAGKNDDVKAWLYQYTFDLDALRDLSVKEFEAADKEWIRFVLLNRKSGKNEHDYDVVIGPTANDNTRVTIRAFFAGAYGETDSDEAIDKLIEMIEPDKLPAQFFFGSAKAAELLTLVKRTLIK